MIPPVIVDFQIRGIPEVSQAFRSVGDRVAAFERQAATEATRQARARVSAAEAERKAREKEYAQLAKSIEAQEKAAAKEAERDAKERVRAMIAADKEIARAKAAALRDMQRQERDAAREAERAAQEQTRVEQREIAQRLAAEKAAAREKEREFAAVARAAEKYSREAERAELSSTRHRADVAMRFTRAAGGGLAAAGHDVMRASSGVMSLVTNSMGGGFDLGAAVQKATKETGLAADIVQSGFLPGQGGPNAQKRTTGEILGVARGAAIEQGLDSTQALGGLQKFVGISGDLDRGLKLLPQLAELSRATGSSLDDLAEAAGNVSLNLGSTDKDGQKTMTVMRGLASQGKLGAVEMRDLASQIAKLSSSAGQFSGDMAENMLKMGALAQEARGEGGAFSASVAANAVRGFSSTLQTGARIKAFKGAGIDVFADKGHTQFKAPEELIVEALKKTGGNREQMNDLFKNIMGARAVEGFAQRFTRAGGGEAGEAAVRARFAELFKGNMMSAQDVKQAAAERSQEADVRMAKIVAEFDRAVAEQLIPELTKLIPTIKDMIPLFVQVSKEGIPAFVDLIKTVAEFVNGHREWIHSMAEHPIGTLIAFELTKSFAAAALPDLLKRLITAAFPASPVPGGGGTPAPGAGALPTAAAAAAAAAGVYGGGATALDASRMSDATGKDVQTQVTTLFSLAKELRAGNVSPERRAQIEKYSATVRQNLANAQKTDTGFGASMDAGVLSGLEKVGNVVGIDSHRFQDRAQNTVRSEIIKQNAGAIETALLQLDKAKAATPQNAAAGGMIKIESKLDDNAARAMRDFANALDRNRPNAGGTTPQTRSVSAPDHPARSHSL